MCNGLLDHDSETLLEKTIIGGIVQLECVRRVDDSVDVIHVTPDAANDSSFDGFELFHDPFSLSQHLGIPRFAYDSLVRWSCNDDGNHEDWAVSAWRFDNSELGKFGGLRIACNQLPD